MWLAASLNMLQMKHDDLMPVYAECFGPATALKGWAACAHAGTGKLVPCSTTIPSSRCNKNHKIRLMYEPIRWQSSFVDEISFWELDELEIRWTLQIHLVT